jgi:hypothetical protein
MLPSGEPRGRAARRRTIRAAAAALVVVSIAGLAACASMPPPAAGSVRPTSAAPGITLLGPWPESGCFHVELVSVDRYRFVLDEMEYPAALGAGRVEVTVRAIDIGELAPPRLQLLRHRRLEFSAEGPAGGAFEITLSLVDAEGHHSDTTRLNRICDH